MLPSSACHYSTRGNRVFTYFYNSLNKVFFFFFSKQHSIFQQHVCTTERDIAAHIKKAMDEVYGPSFHLVVRIFPNFSFKSRHNPHLCHPLTFCFFQHLSFSHFLYRWEEVLDLTLLITPGTLSIFILTSLLFFASKLNAV